VVAWRPGAGIEPGQAEAETERDRFPVACKDQGQDIVRASGLDNLFILASFKI
jgi:hypothetical protein